MGSFVLLIASAVATAIGIILPFFVRAAPVGKGGCNPCLLPYEMPSALMLMGIAGMVVGVAGIARSRPSWRRLSVISIVCGGLALLLVAPGPWGLSSLAVGFPYAGIWLGGLLGLVAIGTAVGAFIHPMRNKALDIPLAVIGLLAGLPSALFALWILGLTIGPGMGE